MGPAQLTSPVFLCLLFNLFCLWENQVVETSWDRRDLETLNDFYKVVWGVRPGAQNPISCLFSEAILPLKPFHFLRLNFPILSTEAPSSRSEICSNMGTDRSAGLISVGKKAPEGSHTGVKLFCEPSQAVGGLGACVGRGLQSDSSLALRVSGNIRTSV